MRPRWDAKRKVIFTQSLSTGKIASSSLEDTFKIGGEAVQAKAVQE